MKQVPLSLVGSATEFAVALERHRADLEAHRLGEPDQPSPIANQLVDALVLRVPDTGPVAERGPDKFVIAPYVIVDDTPTLSAEPGTELALAVLRETISG